MIFEFKEIKCIFEILKMLNTGKSKYTTMFRKIKVSHTTLQSVLKDLAEKGFIVKYDIGHQKVDYEVTNKGRRLLAVLLQLHDLLK